MEVLYRTAVSRSGAVDLVQARDRVADRLSPGIMAAQQRQRRVLLSGGNHAAEAAAHVEDLVHLVVGGAGALLDEREDRRRRQGVGDLVTDVRGQPQQVL